MMYQPLADRIRPQTLDEVVGQRHILGENGLLRRVIESGKIPNMVFYGPSGTGKTTVANIIANRSGRALRRLNATTASLSDVRDIMDEVGTLLAPNGVLLYLDEIQYFNKKQQQSLLEFIENGKITLIASTTENPYFTIFNAILSRSTVFEFKALTAEDILPAVERGFRLMGEELEVDIRCEPGVAEKLAAASGGDVRKAINGVDVGNFWIKTLRVGPHPIEGGSGTFPDVEMYFLPVQCQHCENPECVKVCPTEASHVAEDGTIQIDKDKCIGCQFCAMACPYGVRYLNQTERVVEKCTLCEQRTSQGELPQCVAQCGARARFFGDLDQGVENFEAPAHPDTPGCQYDDMTKTRVKLKDYVEAFTENDIHHLTNKGNNPKLMYLLREGRKWRE